MKPSNTTGQTTPQPRLDCGCVNNGTCQEDKTCKCPAKFYGTKCELVVCGQETRLKSDTLTQLQCTSNGYCMRNTMTSEYMCKCNPGHTGALCEQPSCLNYCYNGGACNDGLGAQYQFELETNRTVNLSCVCPSGSRFYGSRCEFDKCFEEAKNCSAKNKCWLDDNCMCNCNEKCDATFCNKLGKCELDSRGDLSCT